MVRHELIDTAGVLLLDKPVQLTSNRALQRVRGIYGRPKAGHTGTLDPLASGLLPLCLGEMTKFSPWLVATQKTYRASILLGRQTDTDDVDGEVIASCELPADLDIETVEALLPEFCGSIRQTPPLYSALHQGGERLYRRARRGEAPEVPARQVEIESIRALGLEGSTLRIEVRCGKGTYIRSLARDIGAALGCGGCIAELRRAAVGAMRVDAAHTLEHLQSLRDAADIDALEDAVIPIETALGHLPALQFDAEQAGLLLRGVRLAVEGEPLECSGAHQLIGPEGFIGIGCVEIDEGACIIAPRRMCASAVPQLKAAAKGGRAEDAPR
ncbi:MAG: tRNA pseudouridine(55) synthase TruB [Gammaproteobacteria bacterium AqS3]|nr:tRNA pseudouridine(55) synthase TruB [Gammaproteobacteria bacterium AqS3]